jgi:hypothetical protein
MRAANRYQLRRSGAGKTSGGCAAYLTVGGGFVWGVSGLGVEGRVCAAHRIPKSHVDRLFSLRHHSRFDQIESAFSALGKSLRIEVRDAA